MNLNPHLVQVVILVCSASGCVLHSFPHFGAKRWAFRASLVAQPFWFYTAWQKGQWGIQLLAVLFTIMAVRGLMTHKNNK